MTRDEVIDMAKEAGFTSGEIAWHDDMFEAFAKLVTEKAAAKEREACAKLADKYMERWTADAIRARGQA